MWEYFCHGDTCPLSSMAASLLSYVWQSSTSTLDTMTYQTRVVILHLSGKESHIPYCSFCIGHVDLKAWGINLFRISFVGGYG